MAASWRRILTTADTTDTVTNGSSALPDGDAVYDFVIGLGYTSNTGDITGVTAGTGLTGGGGSGAVTLAVSGLTVNEIAAGSLLVAGETFADNDTSLMTAAAINDRIESFGYTTNTGDITGVTAGTGLTGGGGSGAVTLAVSGLTVNEIAAGSLLISGETFADNDTSLMTAAAINDRIESFGYTTNTGDITGVTAGTGLTGGGGSGAVTLAVSGLTVNEIAAGSLLISGETFADNDTSLMTAAAINDRITSFGYTTNTGDITNVTAGTNLSGGGGSGSVTINLATALTGMTSMAGDDGTGSNGSASDLTLSGGISTGAGIGGDILFKTSTVDADGTTNANSLETAMTIAAATSEGADTTVTINGDLVVNGSTSSVDVQTLTVEDKTIEIAEGAHSDATADGAGLIVDTTTTSANKASFKWVNSSVGLSGWEVRDSGASLPQMGVAVLNKYTADPTITTMPQGSLAFNDGSGTGTAGLYLYIDGA